MITYWALVRHNRNFRYLWLGQVVSLLGDWFNLIASAALVSRLTGSGLAVGGLFVVRMLAPFLVGPLAGVAADRYNRKHLLILTDIGRAVVVLGFLLVRSSNTVWLLYTLTALQLALSGFFVPARNAILPDVVSKRELGAANALSSTTWSVMLAFGAALGGIVAGQFGAYIAFFIDALTFLGSAALLSQVNYHHERKSGANTLRAATNDYLDGLRYLRRNHDALALTVHKGLFGLLVGSVGDVVQVAISEDVFVIGKDGGTGLGLMFTAIGIGSGIGPILTRHFTGDRDHALRVAVGVAYLVLAAGIMLVATLGSFELVLLGLVLRAFGGGMLWVFSTHLLFQTLPETMRGRVFSTEYMLFTLLYSVGAMVGGAILESSGLGIGGLLAITGTLLLIPGGWWLGWYVRRHPHSAPDNQA